MTLMKLLLYMFRLVGKRHQFLVRNLKKEVITSLKKRDTRMYSLLGNKRWQANQGKKIRTGKLV